MSKESIKSITVLVLCRPQRVYIVQKSAQVKVYKDEVGWERLNPPCPSIRRSLVVSGTPHNNGTRHRGA